jgi:hypothetical protein
VPELAVRAEDLEQAGARVGYAPADRVPGDAKRRSDLAAVKPVGDALHDLPLRSGQLVQGHGDPLRVLQAGEPGVLRVLLASDVASLDEPTHQARVPARPALDEVVDCRRAGVAEGVAGHWPRLDHGRQGRGRRVFRLVDGRPGEHGRPHHLPVRGPVEVPESRRGHGRGNGIMPGRGDGVRRSLLWLYQRGHLPLATCMSHCPFTPDPLRHPSLVKSPGRAGRERLRKSFFRGRHALAAARERHRREDDGGHGGNDRYPERVRAGVHPADARQDAGDQGQDRPGARGARRGGARGRGLRLRASDSAVHEAHRPFIQGRHPSGALTG